MSLVLVPGDTFMIVSEQQIAVCRVESIKSRPSILVDKAKEGTQSHTVVTAVQAGRRIPEIAIATDYVKERAHGRA